MKVWVYLLDLTTWPDDDNGFICFSVCVKTVRNFVASFSLTNIKYYFFHPSAVEVS